MTIRDVARQAAEQAYRGEHPPGVFDVADAVALAVQNEARKHCKGCHFTDLSPEPPKPECNCGRERWAGHQPDCAILQVSAPLAPAVEPEPTYPCHECGTPRTKAEGGTTFAVCDACWDKREPSAVEPPSGDERGYDRSSDPLGIMELLKPALPLAPTPPETKNIWCMWCLTSWKTKDAPSAIAEAQAHELICEMHPLVIENKALKARLSSPSPGAVETPEGWQPIETAPEAEFVMVWVPHYGWMRGIKTTVHGIAHWWSHEEAIHPSHWQPAPTKPRSQEGADDKESNLHAWIRSGTRIDGVAHGADSMVAVALPADIEALLKEAAFLQLMTFSTTDGPTFSLIMQQRQLLKDLAAALRAEATAHQQAKAVIKNDTRVYEELRQVAEQAEQAERLTAYALKLEREHSSRVTAELRQAEQARDAAIEKAFRAGWEAATLGYVVEDGHELNDADRR